MGIEYKTLTLKIPVPRWRYLRFSLGSILFLCVVLSLALGWWLDHHKLKQEIYRLENPVRGWDTDQVLGPPNTPLPGDYRTAWASKTADGQDEWLILVYDKQVVPTAVEVHENYKPGALAKVSIFDQEGKEIVVWTGVDPTPPGSASGISTIDIQGDIPTQRIKLYLDSTRVTGWNEIDAVGLRYGNDQILWATRAYASSSYGVNNQLPQSFTISRFNFFR